MMKGCHLIGLLFLLVMTLPCQAQDFREMSRMRIAELEDDGSTVEPMPAEHRCQSIFERLLAGAERKDVSYQLYMINNDKFCAEALPDGSVIITTGLLTELEDEDELAFVLAHEIMHVEKRHLEKLIKGSFWGNLTVLSSKLLKKDQGAYEEAKREATKLFDSGFNRQLETEADKEGMRLMSRMGFDLGGALDAFDVLARLEAEKGGKRVFPTHPKGADRCANGIKWLRKSCVPALKATNKSAQDAWASVRNHPLLGDEDNQARVQLSALAEALPRVEADVVARRLDFRGQAYRETYSAALSLWALQNSMNRTDDDKSRLDLMFRNLKLYNDITSALAKRGVTFPSPDDL